MSSKLVDIMVSGSSAQRVAIANRSFKHFAPYYFPEYFTYPSADFHEGMFEDFQRLMESGLTELAWVMFRESAKSSIAKMGVCWAICTQKKKYINWSSYDKSNAEGALVDIANALQTNDKIIRDFGQLYYEDKLEVGTKVKRLNNFVTTTGVKVEAFSTQESTRGRVYGSQRPDLFIFDDVETSKTKDSYPITKKIIEHIDEARAGLSPDAGILYLGNYITEDGVIATILNRIEGSKTARVAFVRAIEDGSPAWEGKYALTDEEAAIRNEGEEDPRKRIVSLEAKERDLTPRVFAVEMMNDPAKSLDYVFDPRVIERLLKNAEEPVKENGGVQIWQDFVPGHRYALGSDTGQGVGNDHSATAIIDFSTMPARCVATFASNTIGVDVFGHEIVRQGNMYGTCFVVPEINDAGYGTIAVLKEHYDEAQIYVREVATKMGGGEVSSDYGFKTTTGTKPYVIDNLVRAVEDGELIVWDKGLVMEMKKFRKQDLRLVRPVEGMTNHFDKLIALALAWEGRTEAKATKEKKSYKQPPVEPGRYQVFRGG